MSSPELASSCHGEAARRTPTPCPDVVKPTVAQRTEARRPALPQAVCQRLEEAYQRLVEQGLPVTYRRLAGEAHVGDHAVAAFLQE